jgi:FixJ family two-component response regulator
LSSATYLTRVAAKFLGSDDAEQQVAARVKAGMSARQIAVELGIAEAPSSPIAAALAPVWELRTSVSFCLHKTPSEG